VKWSLHEKSVPVIVAKYFGIQQKHCHVDSQCDKEQYKQHIFCEFVLHLVGMQHIGTCTPIRGNGKSTLTPMRTALGISPHQTSIQFPPLCFFSNQTHLSLESGVRAHQTRDPALCHKTCNFMEVVLENGNQSINSLLVVLCVCVIACV
jgi:hypothetical protein